MQHTWLRGDGGCRGPSTRGSPRSSPGWAFCLWRGAGHPVDRKLAAVDLVEGHRGALGAAAGVGVLKRPGAERVINLHRELLGRIADDLRIGDVVDLSRAAIWAGDARVLPEVVLDLAFRRRVLAEGRVGGHRWHADQPGQKSGCGELHP